MSAPSNSVYQNGQGQLSGDQMNTWLQGAANVSALRGFIGVSGMDVYLNGFNTINDGGQGTFYWNASGTGPDDGGVTNVVPNGAVAGCWTRFGASGSTIVNSLTSPNSTIKLSGTSGNITEDINLTNPNVWTGVQTFQNGSKGSTPIVGAVRNLVIAYASATTATVTADEVVVETALGGIAVKFASLNVTLNLGNVGANGMDTGTAPTSAPLYLYAIFNPITQTGSVLATTASSGSIYSGANMPSGYTMSGLIAAFVTNGSAQFNVFTQYDRELFYQSPQLSLNGVAGQTNLTSQVLSAIPPNAKTVSGYITYGGTGSVNMQAAADNIGTGYQRGTLTGGTIASLSGVLNFRQLPLITAQTIYWASGGTSAASIVLGVESYTI